MDSTPSSQSPGQGASEPTGASPARRFLAALRQRPVWVLLFVVALVVLAVRLNGTWTRPEIAEQTQTAAKDGKTKNEKSEAMKLKEPFNFGTFSIRPSEMTRVEAGIKPGHWTAAALEARANLDDFRGELIADMHGSNGAVVDLDGVPFRLQSARPAILPKGQKKLLDVTLFDPVKHVGRLAAPKLVSRNGSEVWRSSEVVSPMSTQQYFFVVLARAPDDYRYLVSLDSVWAPMGSYEDRGAQAHYRVLLPKVDLAAPMPNQAIYWTSTAVLLWDGIDPKILTDEQQQALVDWLHWGGRLIVSGPDSLELARDTFLAPYLPATAGESWKLDEGTLQALATAAPEIKDSNKRLRVAEPWSGLKLLPAEPAANVLIATGDGQPLVVERRVGRGSTVVTAFRLAQSELVNWPSYDSMFNVCLLRRPARQFYRSPEDRVGVHWADSKDRRGFQGEFGTTPMGSKEDAERVSNLRYLSRDSRSPRQASPPEMLVEDNWNGPRQNRAGPIFDAFDDEQYIRAGSGVAGWDDESGVSLTARETLIDAAGIQIPNSSFVLKVLAAYLLVLVPLNWAFFRWLGRVEMAWVAAPLIAVVFGVLVVRLAQLDIGFARSSTEIAVLEVQGPYQRANLTRYCALYASLSSEYTLEFQDPAAVALPLAGGADVLSRQVRDTVVLRRLPDPATGEAAVRLENLTVSSNATGMLHSEEIFALGGSVELTPLEGARYRITNGSALRLQATTIVQGNLFAWLDTLSPGESREFALTETDEDEVSTWRTGWRNAVHQGMKLEALGAFAVKDTQPGEIRLVAWTEDELPGLSITPAASQAQHATVVVAHLSYGPPAPMQLDLNSRSEMPADAALDAVPFEVLKPSPPDVEDPGAP